MTNYYPVPWEYCTSFLLIYRVYFEIIAFSRQAYYVKQGTYLRLTFDWYNEILLTTHCFIHIQENKDNCFTKLLRIQFESKIHYDKNTNIKTVNILYSI